MNELMAWLQQFPRTTRCSAILGRAAVELSPDTFVLLQGLCVPAECVDSVLRSVRKRVLGYPVRASLKEVLAFEDSPWWLLDGMRLELQGKPEYADDEEGGE